METTRTRNLRLVVGLVAVAVLIGAGAATAAGPYDAVNADKVDGRHAVGPNTSQAKRAGNLVATDGTGRLPTGVLGTAPDSRKLDGYTPAELSALSLPPQGTHVSGSATASSYGPVLPAQQSGGMRVGFVVPPSHDSRPLTMRVMYLEGSADSCSWYVYASGLEGPDGPNSESNVHNGGWTVPGTTNYEGLISVPAGAGSVHEATFRWPFQDDPGMFIQFALDRAGDVLEDTCSSVTIVGLELRY